VHAIDIFTSKKRGAALSTARAVEAIGEVPVLCVQGADEHDSLCPEVAGRPRVRREVLTGGHHFDGDYGRLAGLILDAAGPP
jgi:type IV secretory pathway VirJ component